MTYFVTKYALTTGIEEYKESELRVEDGLLFNVGKHQFFHGEGKEWHRTKESAIARAEVMRLAKIASLKKSIAKFEKLSFNNPKAEYEASDAAKRGGAMSAHTPAPWVIEPNSGTAINAGKKHIAMVNFFKSIDDEQSVFGEEHDANARLISAAPDLLEAAQMALGIFHVMDWENDATAEKLRAAIAKALGQA